MNEVNFNDAFFKFRMTEKWYPLSGKKGAVLTQINNEDKFFPIWLKHYSKYYSPEDIYVLNHNSDGDFLDLLNDGAREKKFNLISVHHQGWFSSIWMCVNYSLFQRFLLQSYETVLCCDCDEIIDTNPLSQYKNLKEYYENLSYVFMATYGMHICSNPETDLPIDINRPILHQRNRWVHDPFMNKPLLSRVPLDYNIGQHNINNGDVPIDFNLIMFHLHYIDIDWIVEKNNKRKIEEWNQLDVKNGFTKHNFPASKDEKIKEFLNYYQNSQEIPEIFRDII